MTLRTPPSWLQNGSHPAENDRLTLSGAIWYSGGVSDSGDMKVTPTATPSMAVVVAAGRAIIAGTQTTTQGFYVAYNDAPTTLSVATANASLARIDRVCVVIQDAYYGGTTNNQVLFQVVTGTPSSTPVAPAAPSNSITLATILVAAAVTTITSGAITDTRASAMEADVQVTASVTTADSLTINGVASQTGKALNVKDSTGATKFAVSAAGVVTFPDGSTQSTSSVYNPNLTINAQTGTTYTFNATDAQKLVTFNNVAVQTVTIASNATQNLPVGTQIQVAQLGAGQVTIAGATTPNPVTIYSTPGLKLRTQYSVATLVQIATDTWLLIGDLAL